MKFHKVLDEKNMYFLHRSENEVWELYIMIVMFGVRVRLGRVGSMCSDIDYCAGANQENVETLFSMIKAILEKVDEKEVRYIKWPIQERKPLFGTECAFKLSEMAGVYEEIEIPPVNRYRMKVMGMLNMF